MLISSALCQKRSLILSWALSCWPGQSSLEVDCFIREAVASGKITAQENSTNHLGNCLGCPLSWIRDTTSGWSSNTWSNHQRGKETIATVPGAAGAVSLCFGGRKAEPSTVQFLCLPRLVCVLGKQREKQCLAHKD